MRSDYLSVTDGDDGTETIIRADGPEIKSVSTIKYNITPEQNLLKDVLDTDIYSFQFKSNLARNNASAHYGFVIGENYNTSPKILNRDSNKINMYSALGVLWGGVKELAA